MSTVVVVVWLIDGRVYTFPDVELSNVLIMIKERFTDINDNVALFTVSPSPQAIQVRKEAGKEVVNEE